MTDNIEEDGETAWRSTACAPARAGRAAARLASCVHETDRRKRSFDTARGNIKQRNLARLARVVLDADFHMALVRAEAETAAHVQRHVLAVLAIEHKRRIAQVEIAPDVNVHRRGRQRGARLERQVAVDGARIGTAHDTPEGQDVAPAHAQRGVGHDERTAGACAVHDQRAIRPDDALRRVPAEARGRNGWRRAARKERGRPEYKRGQLQQG